MNEHWHDRMIGETERLPVTDFCLIRGDYLTGKPRPTSAERLPVLDGLGPPSARPFAPRRSISPPKSRHRHVGWTMILRSAAERMRSLRGTQQR